MFDFRKENRDGSTFLMENVSDSAIKFWCSWDNSSRAKKKETIDIMKRYDDSITKSTVKLVAELDKFLAKHYDMLTGAGRKDIVRAIV